MKRKQGWFLEITVLLIAVMFTVAGCDNGSTSGDDNSIVDDNNDNNGNKDNNGNNGETSEVEEDFFLPDGYAWVNSGGSYALACVFKNGSLYSYMRGSTGSWALLTTLAYTVNGNNLQTTSSSTGTVTTYSLSDGNLIATATTAQTFVRTEVALPSP
jgi:hypothetical protein